MSERAGAERVGRPLGAGAVLDMPGTVVAVPLAAFFKGLFPAA